MLPEHSTTAEFVEEQVLGVVASLVAEIRGGKTATPALGDSLDRDLGIGSLERVELLLRIERTFGLRLPDSVMAEATTPKDLVAAILHASPVAAEPAGAFEAPAPATSAPPSTRTLVDVLRWHTERTPDRTHIHLRLDDGTEKPITYRELLAGSTSVAAGLHALGVAHGEPVALMLRTEQAYFEAFFGTLLAGALPVPLYPPLKRDEILDYARRQQAILRNAGARVLVTFSEAAGIGSLLRAHVPSLEVIATVETLITGRADVPVGWAPVGEDPALLQYTSGSTGMPKGVLLSHANILANIRAIGEAIAVRPADVTVSWLPLYHDMGLIGAWLGSLYFGMPLTLMSPLAFLARPARWLWAIHDHYGTLSPAPNFAFDLCVNKIADEEITGLDLSGWRLALNGSEVVSPETIERFTRRFAAYGFRADAMCPVYGLAEASVGLTVPVVGRPARVDRIARQGFEDTRALRPAASGDPHPLQFVSCGRPLPGHEIRVIGASGRPVGERTEGHIQFRGPSVTRGYFENPEATRAALHDGWMDSGDLGYWADGDLFITGREKDLIILSGRNVYAQEIEDSAATVAGIRKGCVAAFGVHDPAIGTERLVVVAESRERDSLRREELRQEVLDRIVRAIGVPPDVVVIAGPGTVLKTSSGKIRRSATRDAFINHTLGNRKPLFRQWISLLFAALRDHAARLVPWSGRLALTGYATAVLVVTLPILWLSLVLVPAGVRANRAAKTWSRFVLAVCGLRPRVTGLEHLAGIGSGILVANHASYIDAVVLMAAIPSPFHFIAKRRLADYPIVGTVLRKAQHVTIEKADMSQRLAGAGDIAALLRKNDLVMIFPEGTFIRSPGLLPFRLGAFNAAVETGQPIVPVAIRGTRHVLPDGTWLFSPGHVEVTIGAPLVPRTKGWQEIVRLRDAARDEISRGCGESSVV